MLVLASAIAGAQEPTPTPTPSPTPSPSAVPGDVILIDRFGKAVSVPQSDVPKSLLPPASVGIEGQLPAPVAGSKLPSEVLQRMDSGHNRVFTLFPAAPARLEPYLAAQDQLGNTVIQPGALVDVILAEPAIQGAKYWLSARGLRYSISQVFTYTGVPDTPSGSPNMGYYTLKFFSKWAVYDSPDSGTAGWLSAQVNAKEGLGGAGHNQSAEQNIRSLTNPTGTFAARNGARVPELAWQQSFAHGKFVALAGVVGQSNYLDINTYANTGRGEFLNSALINSMVVPLPSYNFSVNLQWQPSGQFYALLGATAGNATAGQTPWTDFSWEDWSVVTEFGFMPEDFLGLGPGVYRFQPFLAQNGGPVQGGIGFNFQQQLGHESPFAWFGRFGTGGSQVSAGASTQVGTGFVVNGPLQALGLVPRLSNDQTGVGFVWSQPSATTHTVYHRSEYAFETFYTLQFSPTLRVQPDFQLVWNPVFNPASGPYTVVQTQLILTW